ncbi:MAG: hypothetical protein ACR2P2_19835 [Nakamurella sp.]
MFQAYKTRDELAATITKPHPDNAADFAAQVHQATSSTDTIGSPAGMAEWSLELVWWSSAKNRNHQATATGG